MCNIKIICSWIIILTIILFIVSVAWIVSYNQNSDYRKKVSLLLLSLIMIAEICLVCCWYCNKKLDKTKPVLVS